MTRRHRKALLWVEGVIGGTGEGHDEVLPELRKGLTGRGGGVGGTPPPRSMTRTSIPLSTTLQPFRTTFFHQRPSRATAVSAETGLDRQGLGRPEPENRLGRSAK